MPELIAIRYTVEVQVTSPEDKEAVLDALDAHGNILPALEGVLYKVFEQRLPEDIYDRVIVSAEED